MNSKITVSLLLTIPCIAAALTSNSSSYYADQNQGAVSFDVSMPIDATGYTLHGKNLQGGPLKFTDKGAYIAPLLAYETGHFQLPTSFSPAGQPFIETNVHYKAIKLINPNGIDNLFIKIGVAERTQKVFNLDPYVLKNGTYTWSVPIFAFGKEANDVNDKSKNWQLMQVATGNDPSKHNGMYTLEFYLLTQANGSLPISAHPTTTPLSPEILSEAYTTRVTCSSDGLWGDGGSDPYRTLQGKCQGSIKTFPAGPNLDYEYGSFTLPTVLSPWTATAKDHCLLKGGRHAGCVDIKIASQLKEISQKIRVPLEKGLVLTSAFGTLYRTLDVDNLRYQCKSNVYLKKIMREKECYRKSYLSGGWSAPYFSVGFEFTDKDKNRYIASYIYTPEKENSNRIHWNDASSTRIYLTDVLGYN